MQAGPEYPMWPRNRKPPDRDHLLKSLVFYYGYDVLAIIVTKLNIDNGPSQAGDVHTRIHIISAHAREGFISCAPLMRLFCM